MLFSEEVSKVSRPSWRSSTLGEKEKYKASLELKLEDIEVPAAILHCRDVKCRDSTHCDLVDKLTVGVLECVQMVAEECLPCPGGGCNQRRAKHKIIPGWK